MSLSCGLRLTFRGSCLLKLLLPIKVSLCIQVEQNQVTDHCSGTKEGDAGGKAHSSRNNAELPSLAVHGEVKADPVQLQQVPVELLLRAPVVGGSSEIVPHILQAEGILWLALGSRVVQVTVPLDKNSDASSSSARSPKLSPAASTMSRTRNTGQEGLKTGSYVQLLK